VSIEPLPDYHLVAQSYPAEDLRTLTASVVAIWVRSSLAIRQLEIQSLLQRDRMAAVQIKNSKRGWYWWVGGNSLAVEQR